MTLSRSRALAIFAASLTLAACGAAEEDAAPGDAPQALPSPDDTPGLDDADGGALADASAEAGDDAAAPRPPTKYTNAVLAKSCPDPGVLATGGAGGATYTMTCTGGRFRIWQSKDLITWKDTGKSIFPAGKPPWAKDGKRDWAPEIHALGPSSFVAYYTASDAQGHLAIGVAHASSPLGPWTDKGAPLVQNPVGVIDATFFEDDDGERYLYYKIDGNSKGQPTPIYVRRLANSGLSFAAGSKAKVVLTNDASTWEGGVVEAPWVVKHGAKYFLFYSGNVYDDRYRTGVARADSPTGPFTKKGAPILGNNKTWVGPGHGSVVRVGKHDWFVHHAWPTDGAGHRDAEKGRWVLLDRVVWSASGWPTFKTGSSAVGEQAGP